MVRQVIRSKPGNRARIYWLDNLDHPIKDSAISLDFNPILKEVNKLLKIDECVLLHWQARPKGLRRWGCFDVQKQQYFAANSALIEAEIGFCVQLNETVVKTVPTAMIVYPYSSADYVGDTIKVVQFKK